VHRAIDRRVLIMTARPGADELRQLELDGLDGTFRQNVGSARREGNSVIDHSGELSVIRRPVRGAAR
jgi:hypothetical protein